MIDFAFDLLPATLALGLFCAHLLSLSLVCGSVVYLWDLRAALGRQLSLRGLREREARFAAALVVDRRAR